MADGDQAPRFHHVQDPREGPRHQPERVSLRMHRYYAFLARTECGPYEKPCFGQGAWGQGAWGQDARWPLSEPTGVAWLVPQTEAQAAHPVSRGRGARGFP